MLRRSPTELASAKYRVGTAISPIASPAATAWATSSWSKTKSSLLRWYGIVSSRRREYARKPVWYSDRRRPKTAFSRLVRKRLLTNFQRGMPPASGSPRKRLPSMRSIVAAQDRLDESRDPGRVVLVVGMEHDHDVGPRFERRVVAGLLVAAVAAVLAVDDHLEAEPPGDLHGLVARDVVDEDHPIHEVVGHVRVRALEGERRVIGGHDDHDAASRSGRRS